MIIDNMNVFTDNQAVRSNQNSAALKLMPHMGGGDPVNVTVIVTEAYAAGAAVTVAVQESGDGSDFQSAGSHVLAGPSKPGAMLVFPLPYNLAKPYVRLAYTVSGSSGAGKLFAAITREHFAPYSDGLYIEEGRKVK